MVDNILITTDNLELETILFLFFQQYQIIYQSAMSIVGVNASDSIAVGDSLHHDIKGANAAGIQSVFITGGIHATELGLGNFDETADMNSVKALASNYGAYPSYVLPSFTW